MNRIQIKDIVGACNGVLTEGSESEYISGVKHDSRECGIGDMFVAIIGDNQDGHKYIPQVIEAGCNTLLVSHEDGWKDGLNTNGINIIKVDDTVVAMGRLAKYYLNTLDVVRIAVTGSVGKTSVRDMIYYALSEKFNCGRNLKNFNNFIGLPISIFQFDDNTEVVVLEMGMDKFGEIDYLANIVEPNIAVITNIGISHIENLGSREGIFKAKMEVTEHIRPFSDGSEGVLIFPGDGEFLTEENTLGMYRQIIIDDDDSDHGGRIDYKITNIDDFGLEGIKFNLEHNDLSKTIKLNIPGKHNAVNGSLAIVVAKALGVDMESAQVGLLKTELTGRRLKNIKTDKITIIDDTYNASPASMKSALNVLNKSKCSGRRIAILADMLELGEESERQHFEVGSYAANLGVDMLIAVGEHAVHIAEGARGNMALDENEYAKGKCSYVEYFDNKELLYDKLESFIKMGDIILVKGSRGMKMEGVVEKLAEL